MGGRLAGGAERTTLHGRQDVLPVFLLQRVREARSECPGRRARRCRSPRGRARRLAHVGQEVHEVGARPVVLAGVSVPGLRARACCTDSPPPLGRCAPRLRLSTCSPCSCHRTCGMRDVREDDVVPAGRPRRIAVEACAGRCRASRAARASARAPTGGRAARAPNHSLASFGSMATFISSPTLTPVNIRLSRICCSVRPRSVSRL